MATVKIGPEDGLSRHIFTDPKQIKWYYIPPHLLGQDMQLFFSGIIAQIGLGIDSKVLLDKLGEIEDKVISMTAANFEAKKKEVIKLTTNIETRVSQLIPTELLIAAAACVAFKEGEDFRHDPRKVLEKKTAILEDSDATAFFTHFALVTLLNYKESSSNSVQDYLKLVQFQEMTKTSL